ncbi:hypothetical protein K0H71_15240 [Bacillus sp. IITD106]|nr:hypothetical protein [Bacillus sp. IITD106]
MKLRYNFKDGRILEEDSPNDEVGVAELFKIIVRGKNNNAKITAANATLRYEDVQSVELVFD